MSSDGLKNDDLFPSPCEDLYSNIIFALLEEEIVKEKVHWGQFDYHLKSKIK